MITNASLMTCAGVETEQRHADISLTVHRDQQRSVVSPRSVVRARARVNSFVAPLHVVNCQLGRDHGEYEALVSDLLVATDRLGDSDARALKIHRRPAEAPLKRDCEDSGSILVIFKLIYFRQ